MRDGANLVVTDDDGREIFAPSFSIWTTIEECLNPPLIYEKERGWFTTEPFNEPEIFDFPAGIGPVECVNVEHEEVVLVPRFLDAKRVTFKYGLGDEFIGVLKTLHLLGLDKNEPITVRTAPDATGLSDLAQVSLRDLVASVFPNPATLGERMWGTKRAGVWVTGKDLEGEPRDGYLFQAPMTPKRWNTMTRSAWCGRQLWHQPLLLSCWQPGCGRGQEFSGPKR